MQGGLLWDDLASFSEAFISHCEHRRKHVLKDKEVAHPLRDNEVSFFMANFKILRKALDQSNLSFKGTLRNSLASDLANVALLEGINTLGLIIHCHCTKNTCAGTDIYYDLLICCINQCSSVCFNSGIVS